MTGHKIYTATQDVLVIGEMGADPDATYFAIDRLSDPGDDPNVLKLQYGTQSGATDTKYVVMGHVADASDIDVTALEGAKRTPLIQSDRSDVSKLRYWDGGVLRSWSQGNLEPKELQKISLELDLGGTGKAIIPAVHGKLDLNRITLPPGASLKTAPPSGYKDQY